ncbi:MAG: nucleotidyltransferase domain-containing protein [bacterium (Candidatus Ratteibacteria) CG_4_10_14_3_um_filter_41_18]|uniref:Nucleotidyltransferase domain-containing protein n=2 Tax=Candidatus Ratteibacteria TaxID=2979319 RepID=A0A2M7M211_9BACT|nr:MAG: nucleotidyltransferase domain-containing protein [bacterium (Candidatus Ratteibacteria) CG15_BIG_FIL_POST_REV_8_21_14_020_41_12]PIX76747.1 MAG: nucleotidyltransferase domain-containing protein [bacterium (Candidatus Ratteibacteria) CG_4_10_14_3_um_filter_41_18]
MGLSSIILEIAEKIKNDYQPDKIILYGSFAYGNPDGDSDIDLLIIKKTSERPIDRRIAVRKIADIRQPIAFSPFVITPEELEYRLTIHDSFIEEILNRGKVLYG